MASLPANRVFFKIKNNKKMSFHRNIIGTFFLAWLGLCIFVGSVLHLLYQSDYETELNTIQLAEKNYVKQARDNIESDFSYVISNLRYLASQTALSNFLDYPTEQTLEKLNQKFLSELRARSDKYLQLRYISLDGREIARVNNHQNQVEIVPHNRLQDKSDRYYFKQSHKLKSPKEIYISPIDLNVEQGKIVEPYQPAIRFAMKIFRNNIPRGILLLNRRRRGRCEPRFLVIG